MFTVTDIRTGTHLLQVREELLTGHRCKISPGRLNRGIDAPYQPPNAPGNCPFCSGQIFSVTPVFPDGDRICRGESVTFPNLFPFGEWHTVTVITRRHQVDIFSRREIADALSGQVESLVKAPGYKSINWNYLPSAGASIAHPHLQGLADRRAPVIAERYIAGGLRYLEKQGRSYWEDLRSSESGSQRYLFGDELFWYAHPVPLGEREVRCILPVASLEEFPSCSEAFAEGLLDIIRMYRNLGTHAFNMSLFFDKKEEKNGFSAFCSIISRINPNSLSMSDSAFMERLHLEPVILTLPEDLGNYYRKEC
ncbi:MAG: galactose-1-phosphate uridylyltransferase [Methanoregulaceae archaeon]|nr:galactose-1-phosphate uridylyltransferase [Methanoregulaceae archaeon]MCU0629025.1 galactose-1-phosphate uridylyltransferase [Methanoregulaceae archaeon]